MKREDLSKIFIALYAMLLIMYVAVIVFDFQKEYFADTYLMNIVVLITLHLVVPFIYSEKCIFLYKSDANIMHLGCIFAS